MTSLRSGVKLGLMKKLSLYIFLGLMWCNVGFAELIIFSDIKIGEKVSKYFNDQEISQYYVSGDKSNPAGVIIYDKDKKYSYLLFLKEDRIFKGNFEFYQIYYENSTDKIVGIGSVNFVSSKDSCFQKRKTDADTYKMKNRITSLFNKQQNKHTFPDGTIDDFIMFTGKEKYISFSCYIYDDKIEYRIDALENNYNNYIYKINNQQ